MTSKIPFSRADMPIIGTITLLPGAAALFAASDPARAVDAAGYIRATVEGHMQRAAARVCDMDHPRGLNAIAERRACGGQAVPTGRAQGLSMLAARPASGPSR